MNITNAAELKAHRLAYADLAKTFDPVDFDPVRASTASAHACLACLARQPAVGRRAGVACTDALHLSWCAPSPTAAGVRQGNMARLAKAAGFKYLIYTTVHCDGFMNWPSNLTDYNIGNTPWGAGRTLSTVLRPRPALCAWCT